MESVGKEIIVTLCIIKCDVTEPIFMKFLLAGNFGNYLLWRIVLCFHIIQLKKALANFRLLRCGVQRLEMF
jgi:hypothetical protein